MIVDMMKNSIKRRYNCLINRNLVLKKGVLVSLRDNIFQDNVTIYEGTDIRGSSIGYATYISNGCNLKKSKIGKFCSIGPGVEIIIGNHPARIFVSTHPAFYSIKAQAGFTFADKQYYSSEDIYTDQGFLCEIENDVWIGYGVKIFNGCKIGTGAVVGAGSIVVKDIEPYSINVGIPAKKIGYRFERYQINYLLKSEWWNKDEKWLKDNYKFFHNIDDFIKNTNLI